MTQPGNHSGLIFAPGESNIATQKFSPSPMLFWLKSDMGVSNTRFVAKVPNTFLGLIPLGSRDFAVPLTNVAGVGANVKYSPFKLLFGLIMLIVGFAVIGSSAAGGIVLVLIAIALLSGSGSAVLSVQNNGGYNTPLGVSVFEIGKLRAFQEQINQRLFANNDGLRHDEMVSLQQQQIMTQQLNNQFMQQNFGQAQQPAMPATPVASAPSAAAPAATAAMPVASQPAPATAPSANSGWHADPYSRHEHRYYDGQRWTDHVSNGGVTGTDPAA